MGRKKNHIDEAFRRSLKDYPAVPPEGVWEGISESLNADRRKSRMIWMGRIAASVAILLAAGTTWVLVERSQSPDIGKLEDTESVEERPADKDLPVSAGSETIAEQADTGPSDGEQITEGLYAEGHIKEDRIIEIQVAEGQIAEDHIRADLAAEDQINSAQVADDQVLAWQAAVNRMADRQAFSIPVADPGSDDLLALHSRQAEMASNAGEIEFDASDSEEGIDVFAEFGEQPEKDYDKWAVGGQLSPLYSYRNVASGTERSLAYGSATSSYDEFEKGMLSYAGGMNLNYSPARRFSLQSGIYYSRMGMSITNSFVSPADNTYLAQSLPPDELALANSTGRIETGAIKANNILSDASNTPTDLRESWFDKAGAESSRELKQGEILQQFEYLEVPLIARYRVVDRRLGLNLLGGLSTNFLIGNNVYFQEDGNKENIGTTRDLQPVNYSSVLGVGLQYSINRSFHIHMEPTFRYYLNSVNRSTGIGSHPYSLGFFTGLSYSF